ncbi:MFS transporter, SP family, solute carrier family 2, member 1 [Schistosoma bovis]|uniref:MFS transporter, SP family, solute carrier family 2, member 1 n=1 Tax=Schistosoma bovis TaxID=6184 RepID=A0A430QKL9_SCHBO|nr:MFS transporter, SP family, solute carrier family 2, member 1 [Schistosoma bovis]
MGVASNNGITGKLALTVIITCIGSSFLIGYNLGVLNLPRKNIETYFNETVVPNTPELDSNFFYTHVSTIFVVAAAIGAFSCGWVADGIGRKRTVSLSIKTYFESLTVIPSKFLLVITYSSLMLELAGIPDMYLQYCVFAIGVLNVIVTVVSLPLIERAGRRTLLLWPTVSLALSLLLLTIFVNLAYSGPVGARSAMGIISIILILVYICSFALGLGPVPALIVSEIFRQGPRAAAYSLSQSIQWLSNLIVLCSYPVIQKNIGGYSFLPFLVVVVICWIFFFLFMPETKNRTFDEVACDLAFGGIVVGKRTTALEDRNLTVFTKQGNNDGPASESLLYPRSDNDKVFFLYKFFISNTLFLSMNSCDDDDDDDDIVL